jgi:hypothetical protein
MGRLMYSELLWIGSKCGIFLDIDDDYFVYEVGETEPCCLCENYGCIAKVCELTTMTFPEEEIAALQTRLQTTGFAFTSRVNFDQGKWKQGEIVQSIFGKLRIVELKTIDSLAKYPFLDKLTFDQLYILKKYEKIDVIKFVLAQNVLGY